MIGVTEIILILIVLVLIFGANKLPTLGRGLGEAVKNFKRASRGDDDIVVREVKPAPADAKTPEIGPSDSPSKPDPEGKKPADPA